MPEKPGKPVYMVVFAHPDDAEYGAGGTIKKLTAGGHRVFYTCLTKGNVGSYDRSMTPERLAETRREELEAAAEVLGVEKVFFLSFRVVARFQNARFLPTFLWYEREKLLDRLNGLLVAFGHQVALAAFFHVELG